MPRAAFVVLGEMRGAPTWRVQLCIGVAMVPALETMPATIRLSGIIPSSSFARNQQQLRRCFLQQGGGHAGFNLRSAGLAHKQRRETGG